MSTRINYCPFLLTVIESLPRWIAYWTVGFGMTTYWYWRRILRNLEYLTITYRVILPANRAAVNNFLGQWTNSFENVPSGLQDASEWESIDGDSDNLFSKFKDYILNEERRFKTVLRQLSYNIDQESTLHMFTAGDGPEKVASSTVPPSMYSTLTQFSSTQCPYCVCYWNE